MIIMLSFLLSICRLLWRFIIDKLLFIYYLFHNHHHHYNYITTFELFILITSIASSISSISVNILIQDKICLNWYNQSIHLCQQLFSLNDTKTTTTIQVIKDQILSDTANFSNYMYAININNNH